MQYTRTPSGAIQSQVDVGEVSLIFQAANVRRASTGVHATITVAYKNGTGPVILDEDTYNVGRRSDREALLRGIYRGSLGELLKKAAYPVERAHHDLMLFQRGLWQYQMGALEPVRRGGATERRRPEFVLHPFVMKSAGTILFAPPGMGKSWVGYIMAITVDAGISRFWDVEQRPALLVNLERSAESVDTRIGDVNAALGLERERSLLRLDRRGAAYADVAEAVERVVKREGVGFVVVDSLSRMGLGKMIDDDVANRGMDMLNSLGCAWVVLAHTPRADATHTYGSQMFDAAADVTVQLLTDDTIEGKLGLGLKLMKRNDLPPQKEPAQLALEFDELGLVGIRRGAAHEFAALIEKPTASVLVREWMNEHPAGGDAQTIADAIGFSRPTVTTILQSDEYVPIGRRDRKLYFGRRDNIHNEVLGETLQQLPNASPNTYPTTRSVGYGDHYRADSSTLQDETDENEAPDPFHHPIEGEVLGGGERWL